MRLGTAIVLLALGAILTFALRVDVSGVDLQVVGWILMIVGALGIVLELAIWGPLAAAGSPTRRATPTPPSARRSGAAPRKRPTDPFRPVDHDSPRPREDGGCRTFGSGPDDGRLAARCTTRLQPSTEVEAVVREGVTKWHPGARCTRPGQVPRYPRRTSSCRAE